MKATKPEIIEHTVGNRRVSRHTRGAVEYSPLFAAAGILFAFTVIRLVALRFSTVDLFADESQYWSWSRELAPGYFSKPPLIAWIIAVAERVCGSAEACIRSPAPIFHFGTSLLAYAIGRELYDERTGFWAALSVALATGISFSSRIISTDVPLLFFWTLAILAWIKLRGQSGWTWALVLGVSLGLGTLAKYAMAYFLLSVAVAAAFDPASRRILLSRYFFFACAIALVILLPNLWWNAASDFATLRHTGDNVRGSGARIDPLRMLEFLATQFAVFGPMTFGALLFAVTKFFKLPEQDRLLMAFALPVIILIALVALISRAHPNWAAPALVPAAVLCAAILVRTDLRWLLYTAAAVGLIVQIALLIGDANARRIRVPLIKNGDIYERTMGWSQLGERGAWFAAKAGARTIVAEDRHDLAALVYYTRETGLQVFSWPHSAMPAHHFELSRPLRDGASEPLLFISRCAEAGRFAQYFVRVESLGDVEIEPGPTARRRYFAFRLSGAKGKIGPLLPCP